MDDPQGIAFGSCGVFITILQPLQECVPVIRVHTQHHLGWRKGIKFFLGVAERFRNCLVGIYHPHILEHNHALHGIIQQFPVARFAVAQGLFDDFSYADIPD